MIRKTTWILLSVFVVLLISGYFLNQRLDSPASALTPSPTQKINAIPAEALANLLEISYISTNGSVLNMTKRKDGIWSISSDAQKEINQARVLELTSNLLSLEILSKMPSTSNPADLGLSPPAQKITLRNAQEKTFQIKIGNPTPTGSGYYFQVDGAQPVIVGKGGWDTIQNALTEDNLTAQTTSPP